MALILYSSASAGTGSDIQLPENFDTGLMVFVPSASYAAVGVKVVARLSGSDGMNGNGTASYYDISGIPLSSSSDTTRIVNIVTGGLYYYPNVGGLTVRVLAGNAGNTVTVVGNPILKR